MKASVTLIIFMRKLAVMVGFLIFCIPSVANTYVSTADSLNILEPVSDDMASAVTSGATTGSYKLSPSAPKVEGTLRYHKGYIYSSDNKMLSTSDLLQYFTPGEVEKFRRSNKTYNSGKKILGFGCGAGVLGGVAVLSSDVGITDTNLLILSALTAVVVITPCTIVGAPMVWISKARMKRLVREYNRRYIFAEPE